MRLTSWYIDGYRNLEDVTIDTTRGVILAGNNNAGKSNILRSLADYAALLGKAEQEVPENRFRDIPPDSQSEGEESEERSDGQSPEAGQQEPVGYKEWVKTRASDADQQIEFQATFSPSQPASADSYEELSESYRSYIGHILQNRDVRPEDMRENACSESRFTKFSHKLVIGPEGIEAEYLASDVDGSLVVISGRDSGGTIWDLIYAKIDYDTGGESFSTISDLSLAEMTPESIEEIAVTGENPDEPYWYRNHSRTRPNHGSVIEDGLRKEITADADAWEHIPAIRAPQPKLSPEGRTLGEAVQLKDDYSNALWFLKYTLDQDDRDHAVERYRTIIENVTGFEARFDDGEFLGFQTERHSDRPITTEEISAGSRQVICLIAAILDHINSDTECGSVLSIEEPETHLNPHTQREIVNFLLDDLGPRVSPIITSHSPTLIDQSRMGRPYAVIKNEVTQAREIDTEDLKRLRKALRTTLSDLLQATVVVIVPSRYWEVLLVSVADEFGLDFTDDGILLVVSRSDQDVSLLYELTQIVEVPIISIVDWDEGIPLLGGTQGLDETTDNELESIAEILIEYRDLVEERAGRTPTRRQELQQLDDPERWFQAVEQMCDERTDIGIAQIISAVVDEELANDGYWQGVVDELEGYIG